MHIQNFKKYLVCVHLQLNVFETSFSLPFLSRFSFRFRYEFHCYNICILIVFFEWEHVSSGRFCRKLKASFANEKPIWIPLCQGHKLLGLLRTLVLRFTNRTVTTAISIQNFERLKYYGDDITTWLWMSNVDNPIFKYGYMISCILNMLGYKNIVGIFNQFFLEFCVNSFVW